MAEGEQSGMGSVGLAPVSEKAPTPVSAPVSGAASEPPPASRPGPEQGESLPDTDEVVLGLGNWEKLTPQERNGLLNRTLDKISGLVDGVKIAAELILEGKHPSQIQDRVDAYVAKYTGKGELSNTPSPGLSEVYKPESMKENVGVASPVATGQPKNI